jgi:hypothetical protein
MAATACGGPTDPALALLSDLEAAVEARDADALAQRLAPDFEGRDGMGRQQAMDTVRRLLLGYEAASLEIYEVEQEPVPGGARVSFWVEFSGRPRSLGGLSGLLPPGAVYVFDLELRRGDPDWLVAAASWEERAGAGAGSSGVSSATEGGV